MVWSWNTVGDLALTPGIHEKCFSCPVLPSACSYSPWLRRGQSNVCGTGRRRLHSLAGTWVLSMGRFLVRRIILSPIYSHQKIISEDFLHFCSNPRPLLGSDYSWRTAGILQYHKKDLLTPLLTMWPKPGAVFPCGGEKGWSASWGYLIATRREGSPLPQHCCASSPSQQELLQEDAAALRWVPGAPSQAIFRSKEAGELTLIRLKAPSTLQCAISVFEIKRV